MKARKARNIALVALVVVAWLFAVETAGLGALLQQQGQPHSVVRMLTTVSLGSLLISVLACARAVFVFHEPEARRPSVGSRLPAAEPESRAKQPVAA